MGRVAAVPPAPSAPHRSGSRGFPTPRSLGLTSQLEDRLRQWNEEWHRGFLGYGRDDDGASADLGLPNGGFALPEWADDVDPVAWYREGHAIAASLADQLPGVTVRLRAIRYVCAPRFLHLTKVFGDDEFFTPLSRRRSIMATATGYN